MQMLQNAHKSMYSKLTTKSLVSYRLFVITMQNTSFFDIIYDKIYVPLSEGMDD